MAVWQVQDAKAKLSQVIEFACTQGAQTITHHGAERVVVLSMGDYQALLAYKPNFKTYLLGGPKTDNFTIKRNKDKGRSIKL